MKSWATTSVSVLAANAAPTTLGVGVHRARDPGGEARGHLAGRGAASAHEEWLEIKVPFERFEHAQRDLLGLGDRVEVLGPPELRAQLGATVRTLAGVYAP